jgi:hypothetical protein
MNRAAPAAVTFKEAIDLKLLTPVQRNLFTGEAEPVHVDIDHAIPEDETEVDDGISLVKTEDSAQLILSGLVCSWERRANASSPGKAKRSCTSFRSSGFRKSSSLFYEYFG